MTTQPFPLRAASRRTALLAAAVCLLSALPLRAADFLTVAGKNADDFEKWLKEVRNNDMRPAYINGYNTGDAPAFAGVAFPNKENLEWKTKINLSSDDYKDTFDDMKAKGFRPFTVSGYTDGGRRRYAAAFIKDDKPIQWEARHNQRPKEFERTLKEMKDKGLRPRIITGCVDPDGDVHFTSLFIAANNVTWQSKRGLTAADYTSQVKDWLNDGWRPEDVSVYDTADGPRFAATAVKDDHSWVAVAGMSLKEYKDKEKQKEADGFRPIAICGYRDSGDVRYAAVFYRRD
ncbi:MAG TPA: hypothetical protein VMS17_29120 [Gemmataceae bacterium]|nr:hypothetical protein [Gemmataceae bacterium]